MRIYWNNDWFFAEKFCEELINKQMGNGIAARIPHTVKELPFHYFDESLYQMVSCYQKSFKADPEWKGKVLLLTFDGVAHDSKVYLNGKLIVEHHCGYTAFTVDISDFVSYEQENLLTVQVDSRESLNIPPFGYVIDYMTYGGIYRDVYLDIKENFYLEDVFVHTSGKKFISEIKTNKETEKFAVRYSYRKWNSDEDFICLGESDKNVFTSSDLDVELWDTTNPNLYELKVELLDKTHVSDSKVIRFGFREAEFRTDGFYLNGKKLKIRGLNRHQSYAYAGYAMPKSMQELDAQILKNELGLNAVRTSHYPQSHYFIDKCDEIGLLVFTEIPGWQHIGDEKWKDIAVNNVYEMVSQYRNHTSIILWGVRINESVDDDEFYKRTNEMARKTDPTRQTGGVRCYKKSHLFEDVYTYNDFCHDGKYKGCEKKSVVTSDINKPYMITEYNGHMFPTKAYDWEDKRCEHAIRHVTVLDEVSKQEDIAGSFGWCMFDYNTHKDFGSGDRICYHGVMDMFRNPKLAAAVYASQQEEVPVLEISSTMDIGEHPGCIRGDIYIFTNADSVKMYKNDTFIREYLSSDSEFKNIKHGPIKVDDYIGNQLIENEKMSKQQSDAVKSLLNEAAIKGMNNLSARSMAKAGLTSVRYSMKMEDAVKLYDKYIGNWGGESTVYKFEAIIDGKVATTKLVKPMKEVRLNVSCDHTNLVEGNTYDVALIRINAVDELGNRLPFYNDPVCLTIEGPAQIIGPKVITLQGGMGGTYIKTTGEVGHVTLKIEGTNCPEIKLEFNVSKDI